jgi:mediator of RNA polymerase II transcription subunit 18
MSYEIFLTSFVPDDLIVKARSILCGVAGTPERHSYRHIQHYEPSDPNVKGFLTIKQLQRERLLPITAQWQELHQILAKQPAVVQLRMDITEEVEIANDALTK